MSQPPNGTCENFPLELTKPSPAPVKETIPRSSSEIQSLTIAVVAIFSALTLATGYALAHIPNIELFTALIFLAGFLFGGRIGTAIAMISSILFAYFNPLGSSHLVLFATQVSLYTILGVLGALVRGANPIEKYEISPRFVVLLMVFGGAFTFCFDILTTFAQYLPIVGSDWNQLWNYYLFGLTFTTVHLICNVVAFGFILPVIVVSLQNTNWGLLNSKKTQ